MYILNDRIFIIREILNLLPDYTCKFIHTTGNSLDVIVLSRYYKFTVFNDIHEILFRLFEAIKDKNDMEVLKDDLFDLYYTTVEILSAFKSHINRGLCENDERVPVIVKEYIRNIPFLYEIYLRFSTVQIDYLDFDSCISYYDSKDAFFYAEFFEESKVEIDRRMDILNRCSGAYIVVAPADKVDCYDSRSHTDYIGDFVVLSRLPQKASLFSVL